MDFKALKDHSVKDLHKLLNEQRERLQELRFKVGQNQVNNIRELRQVRKSIAKILTKLNQSDSQVQSDSSELTETKSKAKA